MSSVPQQQQHLTSADMNMIMRVHAGVCTRNAIWEFQHGVSEEARLLAASTADGALNLSILVSRMAKFIGSTLSEREAESGTAVRTLSPRSHIEATE